MYIFFILNFLWLHPFHHGDLFPFHVCTRVPGLLVGTFVLFSVREAAVFNSLPFSVVEYILCLWST